MTNSLPLNFLGFCLLSLPSDFQHLRYLLFILALVAEPVRSLAMALDLVLQPNRIACFVFSPVLPLAAVIFEFGFVHHGDAFLHRANGFAHPAAAAGFHVGVVEVLRRHIEDRIRAAQPAQRAFDASIEIDYRPHGAGGELLEGGIAVRTPATSRMADRVLNPPAGLDAWNGDAFTHLVPFGQIKLVWHFGIALVGLHGDR